MVMLRAGSGIRTARVLAAAPQRRQAAEPLRILLVDDHLPTAFALKGVLLTEGMAVDVANGADAALQSARARQFSGGHRRCSHARY
ncbi:MAG: response regulator [Myxococcota bacterium]